MSSQPEPNESVVLLPVFLTTLSREGEKSQKKPSYIDTPINTHTTQHNMKKDRPVSTNQEPHATVITMGRRVKRTAFPSSHSSTSSNPPHLAAGPSHNLSYLEAIVGVGCVAGDVADAVRSHPGVLALHIAVLVLAFHAALVVGELVVGYCEAKLVAFRRRPREVTDGKGKWRGGGCCCGGSVCRCFMSTLCCVSRLFGCLSF
ncbi:hypothetical protein O3P69_008860 [Scylla paramamosain]|uniref:Uncharacterized protein n=1 Tax=Scylla paramamosain TaxID=85552 RepID=A0AAW0TS57_SCYPA